MTDIVFTIPANRAELLNELNNSYTVRNVVIPGEIIEKLSEARSMLREEGANFILDNFDTYFSVLHHANTLQRDVIYKAYSDLLKAVQQLDNSVVSLLQDKSNLDEAIKAKTVTVMKMLVYIFIQFVIYLEQQKIKSQEDNLGGKRKGAQKSTDAFSVDKSKVLSSLNTLIHRDISSFWEPPIVEHDFVGVVAELCHNFLQNPGIKHEKEIAGELFGVFGTLIKSYDYGETFVTRLIQSVRMYEHVVHCVPEGIKLIVEQFNCGELIRYLVQEATEWQVDETFQDNQGSRSCSLVLTELAGLMPDLMIPEVAYLNRYLSHDSQPLRTSVLNVITEVILNVLTKHDPSEKEKESRDRFLYILFEHVNDIGANVRAKVIQNIARLQKECAIPLDYQSSVLQKVVARLDDKAAAVRKVAINCVTVFLQHNPFAANLQLKKSEEVLAKKVALLNSIEASYKEAKLAKIEEMKAEWAKIEDDVKKTIQEHIDDDSDDEEEADEDTSQPPLEKDEIVELIRAKLIDRKFDEAFKLCRLFKDKIDEWKNLKNVSAHQNVELYLTVLCSFYLNVVKITDELRTGVGMTDEDIKKIEALENTIKYLEKTIVFLRIIDSAIEPMKTLLFTQTVGDMHGAIHFFVTAYQFQIDNASSGITEMLKLMKYNEQERKEGVSEAFRTIYLTTDTKNMVDHTRTIVTRLISFLKELTNENFDDFQNIVSEWTAKGIVDNNVIDRLWQYYTQRESISDDDARAAAELLRMAALGRETIITKNIALVSSVASSEKHRNDMRFLASSFRLLAVAGAKLINIQSTSPPFKIKHQDPIFQSLTDILVEKFFEKVPYYTAAAEAALEFIFKVSSKPTDTCEVLLKRINKRMLDDPKGKTQLSVVRFCQLLGCTALNVLGFLDNTVYRELKRRNYVREMNKENKKNKRKNKDTTTTSINCTVNETASNDSVLMGAEAVDEYAEYILNVMENDIISNSSTLGQFADFLKEIVERPDIYGDFVMQQVTVVALLRYMLVSSKFCSKNLKLLFTVLKKTTWSEMKCTILIHFSDLLTRFPNMLEPWSPSIYEKLKDPKEKVRKTAFYSLSNLILRDMIRAHSHISKMAVCMIDENKEIKEMCGTFFRKLAQKEHNLANVIPDIFSHLVEMDEVSEENLRFIMKFLFDLVDNSKRMENLVDRFCHKYTVNEDPKLNRNVTYCLSLITYNDKALKKLHEKFPMYKPHVHDPEVYSMLKQILAECSKQKVGRADLKPIVTDIENSIASVFDINENGEPAKAPPSTKSAKNLKRTKSKKQTESSDSESDNGKCTKNKKSKKTSRGRKRNQNTTSSDSE